MTRTLRFEWELPEETFGPGFEEQSFVRIVKEAAVVTLLRDSRISQGKAAELLGIGRHELFDLMSRYDVPTLDLSPGELEQDFRNLRGACS